MTHREPMPSRGSPFFRDRDNLLTDAKFEDEIRVFDTTTPLWDLTDWLRGGETIASATFDGQSGLSVSSTGNSTTAVWATITKTGVLEIEVTTSLGRMKKERFAWQAFDEGSSDYKK